MIKIELDENGLKINNVKLKFPIKLEIMQNILGNSRLDVMKYGSTVTWDEVGIVGYLSNEQEIKNLSICYTNKEYKFSPKNNFNGTFLFKNTEIINYRKNNPKQVYKSFKDDSGGILIANEIRCWFEIENSMVLGIDIGIFDGVIYEKPVLKEMMNTFKIQDKYLHLKTSWREWKNEIDKIVPKENQYYNLINGITNEEANEAKEIDKEVFIPDELIDFYKIYNVEYNWIASSFFFSVNGQQYNLIPFNKIQNEWNGIQDLQSEDTLEVENLEDYSEKVKANDYANPRWIPFADGQNGDYLLYDTDPSNKGIYGQIIELQNETWERNVVANSLSDLLHNEINQLKSGKIEKFNFILGKKKL